MINIRCGQDDYQAIVELAGKMQQALRKKVPLGTAAGSACRYVLAETLRVEKVLQEQKKTKGENSAPRR